MHRNAPRVKTSSTRHIVEGKNKVQSSKQSVLPFVDRYTHAHILRSAWDMTSFIGSLLRAQEETMLVGNARCRVCYIVDA